MAACAGTVDSAPPPRPVTPPAERVVLRPDTTSYLFASRLRVKQELQGQEQRTEEALRYRFTIALAPGAEGLQATFSIDSVLLAEGESMSDADVRAATGTRFAALVADTGELRGFAPTGGPSSSQLVARIGNDLKQLFPHLPGGGVLPGLTWGDTTEAVTRATGPELTIHAVTRYRSGDWTQHGSGRALPIDWTRRYTVSGHGVQLGQQYTLTGEGETVGESLLSVDGRYLGGTAGDSTTMEIVLTGVGITIPVDQARADTIGIVP